MTLEVSPARRDRTFVERRLPSAVEGSQYAPPRGSGSSGAAAEAAQDICPDLLRELLHGALTVEALNSEALALESVVLRLRRQGGQLPLVHLAGQRSLRGDVQEVPGRGRRREAADEPALEGDVAELGVPG